MVAQHPGPQEFHVTVQRPWTRRAYRPQRRPTWWTIRRVSLASPHSYEVTLWHQHCPLEWEVVTIDETGEVTCTCADRTPHDVWHQHWGWCAHIEKLMRSALRGYRLVSVRHDPEAHGARCAGCRPTCRAYARRLSPL